MQLRDLDYQKRICAINIKAVLAYEDYLFSLKTFDYYSLKTGIKALFETEKEFFYIDDDFYNSIIEILSSYNIKDLLNKLKSLQTIDSAFRNKKALKYIAIECNSRGIENDYESYLDLLELDDLLLSLENYNYLLDNPFILNSMSYIIHNFYDYINENPSIYIYLSSILKYLYPSLKDSKEYSDICNLLPNFKEEKIITFCKRV